MLPAADRLTSSRGYFVHTSAAHPNQATALDQRMMVTEDAHAESVTRLNRSHPSFLDRSKPAPEAVLNGDNND